MCTPSILPFSCRVVSLILAKCGCLFLQKNVSPSLSCPPSCPWRLALGVSPLASRPWRLAVWRLVARRLAAWRPVLGVLPSASHWCIKSVPISVRCTNQRTLVHPCQNAPRRRHVPIGVLWATPVISYFLKVKIAFCLRPRPRCKLILHVPAKICVPKFSV